MDTEFDFKKAEQEDEENVEDSGDDNAGVRSSVYKISSYGADFDVNGLVRRVEKRSFFVPEFQRQYVWNQVHASRFIESLLLGLPVPGIFVYREKGSEKHQIIDGQQRIESLRRFFSGFFRHRDDTSEDKPFHLIDVDERWNGRAINELGTADRTRLEDTTVHTTVFHQEDPDDDKSIYLVFERLNTGGVKLSPQEIRHCVNHGKFTELLEKLNQTESWRKIYRQKMSVRMKDREMILRFLALYYGWEDYKRPMQEFLNSFMGKHRELSDKKAREFSALFTNTIQFCYEELGNNVFRPKGPLNVASFDSVMVGVAKSGVVSHKKSTLNYQKAYDELLKNKDFHAARTGPTADEANVKTRIRMAIEAFTA